MSALPEIDPRKPVLIAGPTASGKSALALALAQQYRRPIVNADALQVYGCWRVLTARPSPEDEARAPHLLYGHISCDHKYSVGQWLRELQPILQDPSSAPAIIIGGTGLYFTSLVSGLSVIPDVPAAVRETARQRLRTAGGRAAMRADLAAEDPETLARIDAANPRRLQRAWEVLRGTGRGLAAWHDATPPPLLPLSEATALLLEAPKSWLNPRIERRFRRIVAEGGLEECRARLAGWNPALPSARAIGAAELIAHLRGEIDLETAISRAVTATRQYAKRQRSWFRARMQGWRRIDLSTSPCE